MAYLQESAGGISL